MRKARKPEGLHCLGTNSLGEPTRWETGVFEPAFYPDQKDVAEQLSMLVAFEERSKQSEPEKIGAVMYCRSDTPMYQGWEGKDNRGAAVLGWPDFSLVQIAGSESYRFYLKKNLDADFNWEPITAETIAKWVAAANKEQARLAAIGDHTPVSVTMKATSEKFRYG
tara:strand:- start:413 stop:907 length:495 start_codon:yes stop_codon:yes gene_type:complete